MATYLLSWNPANWGYKEFDRYFRDYLAGKVLRWSCGTTKKICTGDDVFLLKQGKASRGIIGFGVVVAAPYFSDHYNDEGKQALYVDVQFHYLHGDMHGLPILREELDAPNLNSKIWNSQGSGKTIPSTIAGELLSLWNSRVEAADFVSPDEVGVSDLPEGAKKSVNVNVYERNRAARELCLKHWGHRCVICNFHFEHSARAISLF